MVKRGNEVSDDSHASDNHASDDHTSDDHASDDNHGIVLLHSVSRAIHKHPNKAYTFCSINSCASP